MEDYVTYGNLATLQSCPICQSLVCYLRPAPPMRGRYAVGEGYNMPGGDPRVLKGAVEACVCVHVGCGWVGHYQLEKLRVKIEMLTTSCQRSSSHPFLTFWTNIFTFIHDNASTFGQSCFLSLLRRLYLPFDTD